MYFQILDHVNKVETATASTEEETFVLNDLFWHMVHPKESKGSKAHELLMIMDVISSSHKLYILHIPYIFYQEIAQIIISSLNAVSW